MWAEGHRGTCDRAPWNIDEDEGLTQGGGMPRSLTGLRTLSPVQTVRNGAFSHPSPSQSWRSCGISRSQPTVSAEAPLPLQYAFLPRNGGGSRGLTS